MIQAYDFVILTVLDEELQAVLARVDHGRLMTPEAEPFGAVYAAELSGSFPARRGIIVPIRGVGRVEAALTVSAMLRVWRPKCVVLVGCAGGFQASQVALGDVLVASEVVDYALHKVTASGTEFRTKRYAVDATLLAVAREMVLNQWLPSAPLHGARVRIGPIASGDRVVASSSAVQEMLDGDRCILGVEMEGAGVIAALLREPSPPGFLMARGVADLADEKKSDEWVERACAVAAAFAVELLQKNAHHLIST